MKRRRALQFVLYLPLVVLAISAIATMTQIGCSAGNSGGYGYGTVGSSGSSGYGSHGYGYGYISPIQP